MGMAERRFVLLLCVEHEEELDGGRAADAVLVALEGIGKVLFPAFAEDREGEERTVSLVGLDVFPG
jgi:hypothetical protein